MVSYSSLHEVTTASTDLDGKKLPRYVTRPANRRGSTSACTANARSYPLPEIFPDSVPTGGGSPT